MRKEISYSPLNQGDELGLVLSGGGSRAAYQAGALRALAPYLKKDRNIPSVIVGSSIGAVNGITLAAAMVSGFDEGVKEICKLWRERTYRNTFNGSPSRTFLKAIQITLLRYTSPGPVASPISIFDPTPLRERIDSVLKEFRQRAPITGLKIPHSVAVVATVEDKRRRPLLFVARKEPLTPQQLVAATFAVSYVTELTAAHGLASAALPSVLPPVELNLEAGSVRLVDGGISDNIPVDPAVRLGASRVVTIDVSGRRWWFDRYGQPHYTRPTWEVASAEETLCFFPRRSFEVVSKKGLGTILKEAVGRSRGDFITALGPTWPIFKILKHKMGEELAYEVMSYVALHPQYLVGLEELGFSETNELLKNGFPLDPNPLGSL